MLRKIKIFDIENQLNIDETQIMKNLGGCEGKRQSKVENKRRDSLSNLEPNQIFNRSEENQPEPDAKYQVHAEEVIKNGSLEHFMQKQLNMKNIYQSSVHILENTLDSLELNNFVEPKGFFEIPLYENIDFLYAGIYNKIIRMIRNGQIQYKEFETVMTYLTECKSSIEQVTFPRLYHNLISLVYTQIHSPSLETDTNLQTHISRIKIIHVIVKNIDSNLALLNTQLKSTQFISVSSKRITDVFPALSESLTLSLMNESNNGIDRLVYFKLVENQREIKPFFSRLFSSSQYDQKYQELNKVKFEGDLALIVSDKIDLMVDRLHQRLNKNDDFAQAVRNIHDQQQEEDKVNADGRRYQGTPAFYNSNIEKFLNQLIFIDELVEQQYSAIVEKFSDDLNLKNIVILCENKNFEISKHKILIYSFHLVIRVIQNWVQTNCIRQLLLDQDLLEMLSQLCYWDNCNFKEQNIETRLQKLTNLDICLPIIEQIGMQF